MEKKRKREIVKTEAFGTMPEEYLPKGNREVASDVFSMLLEYQKNALDVYNALNGSDYKDPNLVQIVRLKSGISLSVRNDASFLILDGAYFSEHQSTHNPNSPLRELFYFTDWLKIWVQKNDLNLYGSALVRIPTPHFLVFYNGEEKRPPVETMYLSRAFCQPVPEGEKDLEVRCVQYNLNAEENRELLERSETLRGYVIFVNKIRAYRKEMELGKAIDQAMDECISEGVLAWFFEERKDEVRKSMVLDFTWERQRELIAKENFTNGEAIGEAKGEAKTILRLLELRFGEIPEGLRNELFSEKAEALSSVLEPAAKAKSLEEFRERYHQIKYLT